MVSDVRSELRQESVLSYLGKRSSCTVLVQSSNRGEVFTESTTFIRNKRSRHDLVYKESLLRDQTSCNDCSMHLVIDAVIS